MPLWQRKSESASLLSLSTETVLNRFLVGLLEWNKSQRKEGDGSGSDNKEGIWYGKGETYAAKTDRFYLGTNSYEATFKEPLMTIER
ncbi:MAG: hypothetical protein LKK13_03395 [Bacilli bacterium]|jgi:hypothetical protein|nr:hypothetical protein [Bacilli bacterium]